MITFALLHAMANTYLWGERSKKTCIEVDEDLNILRWAHSNQCQDVVRYFFQPRPGCSEARNLPESTRRLAHDALRVANLAGGVDPSSYRNLLLNGEKVNVYCMEKLRKVYKGGGSLRSQTIADALVPILEVSVRSEKPDTFFFHYFNQEFYNSEEFKETIEDQDYAGIFRFLKARKGTWGHPFYVAEDPHTSAGFGDTAAVFEIRPDSMAFGHDVNLLKQGWKEVLQRHPTLNNCGNFSGSALYSGAHPLQYAMIEDSGADIVDYTGGKWFQLLDSTVIQDSEWGAPKDIQKRFE